MRSLFFTLILTGLMTLWSLEPAHALPPQPTTVYTNPLGYHSRASKPWAGINLPMTPLVKLHPLVRRDTVPLHIEGLRGRILGKPTVEIENQQTRSVILNASPIKREGTHQLWLYGGLLDTPPLTVQTQQSNAKHYPLKVNDAVFRDVASTAGRSLFLHRAYRDILDPTTGIRQEAGHLLPKPWATAGGWYEGSSYNQHALTQAVTSFYLLEAAHLEANKPLEQRLSFNYPLGSKVVGSGLSDVQLEATIGLQWLLQHQQLRQDKRIPTGVVSLGSQRRELKPSADFRPRQLLAPSQEVALLSGVVLRQASLRLQDVDPDLTVRALLGVEGIKQALISPTAWASYPTLPPTPTTLLNDTAPDQPYPWWEANPIQPQQRRAMLAWWQHTLRVAQQQRFTLPKGHEAALQPLDSLLQPTLPPLNEMTSPLTTEVLQPLLYTQWLAYAEQWPASWKKAFVATAEQGVTLALKTLYSPFASPWNNHVLAVQQQINSDTPLDITALPRHNGEWLTLGIHLAQAYQLSHDPRYLLASQSVWNYLLGYNAWRQPFLTGDAQATGLPLLRYPCNQLVRANGLIIPGLLVAGPNASTPDASTFADQADSCQQTVTHPTWQAKLVYWGLLLDSLI